MEIYSLKNTYADHVLVDAEVRNAEGKKGFYILFGNRAGTLVFCSTSYFEATMKSLPLSSILPGIDLLENYHLLPEPVQVILLDFNEEADNLYSECKETIQKLKEHGYTADYDLSGELFDLKKI